MTTPSRTVAAGLPTQGAALNGSALLPAGALATALPTRQRHRGFIALAVALIVGFGAIGGYLYSTAGAKTPVVMVIHRIGVGQVVQRSDLTTVPVSGRVVAVAGDNLASVVGLRAAVTLLPDTLLQRAMVTAGQSVPAGQAQVGVAVRSGQIPADGLAAGDLVRVVQLPTKGSADAQASVLTERAQVFSSRPDPALSGGTLVTVVVPEAASTAVAAASGVGAVALVKVAP